VGGTGLLYRRGKGNPAEVAGGEKDYTDMLFKFSQESCLNADLFFVLFF
jgi:hypothetical protein